jgi:uncharacterized protein
MANQENILKLQARLQVLSALSSRATLAAKLGQQYGTDRDIYEALGYPTDILYNDYSTRYERQDIAKAIINRPISKTWKGPLILSEAGDDNETAFEKAWKELDDQLKLKSKFIRLDKLSSIGMYGVLLLGFDDVSNQMDWTKPVDGNKRKLIYVKPLGEGSAKVNTYANQSRDPRFGMPNVYDIELRQPGTDKRTALQVHHTRVLHVAGELLESEYDGEPILKAVYNRLMDLEKLVGGSAEMFWRGARPGFQGKIDPEFQMSADDEEALEEQVNEYEHNLRRILMTKGVDMQALATQVTDPAAHVDIQLQMISAVTGIPKRILVGSERGELSSSQDKEEWLENIQERREEHAEPHIIKPFVDVCIKYGVLPKPTTNDWQVEWSDLFAPSEKDKAEVGKTRATALKEYTQNPIAEATVPPDAFMEYFLGLSADQIEHISEMRNAAMLEEQNSIEEETEIEETEE